MTRDAFSRRARRAPASAALLLAACVAGAPGAERDAPGPLPFVWPRDGVVRLMTCRFETAQPIGVVLENAAREDETAVDTVLRAWERAGLGLRFVMAPREHAQLAIAFRDEPLPNAARAVADCKLDGVRAELAFARVEVARNAGAEPGGATTPRGLARDELLGALARELGRALGWAGAAPRGDALHVGSLSDAARLGAALRAGAPLASPGLRALYAQPSGSLLARSVAEPPHATRAIDRLAALALANDLDGPFLRTGAAAGRVFWRERATGDEYGAQIVAPARAMRAPGRVALALEPRARRALPRSRDAAPDTRVTPP